MKQLFLKNIEDMEGNERRELTQLEKEQFTFDTVEVNPVRIYDGSSGRKKTKGHNIVTTKAKEKENDTSVKSGKKIDIEVVTKKNESENTEEEVKKETEEKEEDEEEEEEDEDDEDEDNEEKNGNVDEEMMDEIHREYFKSLTKEFSISKHLKEETKIIMAYNLNDLYYFEFLKKQYVIPPYHKGVLLHYEIENEKIIVDVINKSAYIRQLHVDSYHTDTRKAYDVVYIYSALLPTESDLFSLNYLSKNKLTIKRMHGEHAKALFKNLIPYTKYEDFYEDKKNAVTDLFDVSIFSFPSFVFRNDFLDYDLDDGVYKTKLLELIKKKLKSTLQLNSEETKS